MEVKVKPSHQYSVTFCCHVTDDSRVTDGRLTEVSDMEVFMKKRSITEFLHVEKKKTPINIHWHLLNADGDQTVDRRHSEVVGGVFH